MRLIDKQSGREIREGEIVQLRHVEYRITGLVPKSRTIYLMDLEADHAAFPVDAGTIGAKFAA